MPRPFNRRSLLVGSAFATAQFSQLSCAQFSFAQRTRTSRPAASERIAVGVIGLGSRGMQVMKSFLDEPDVQVVAVCDVHDLHYRDRAWGTGAPMGRIPAQQQVEQHYTAQTKSQLYRGCTAHGDYREVLARDDVDAVVVATPDHWHARIAIDAIRAGKDVYGEKPITHYFAEGRLLRQEVAQHQAIFQVGSQQRSDAEFRRAVELVRNGHLGRIQRVEVGLPPGYDVAQDDTTAQAPPKGIDYDLWCGPAPKLSYMRARHHRWWRSTRAFGGGVLMDWIGHHNDIAHWSLDQDQGGPLRVEAIGWTQSACELYDTPAQYAIHCLYPGEVELVISTQWEQGTKWIGDDGWLWVNRGKSKASDPRWLQKGFQVGPWTAYESPGHTRNFLDCVKTRQPCVTSVETGHRSITPGHLGYVSHALGRGLQWDAKQERIVDDEAAQALLLQAPYRQPWQLT